MTNTYCQNRYGTVFAIARVEWVPDANGQVPCVVLLDEEGEVSIPFDSFQANFQPAPTPAGHFTGEPTDRFTYHGLAWYHGLGDQ